MKTSILYAYVALMGMASAQEVCEEGKRVTISPGYTVQYRCNIARQGVQHRNVASHQDCAMMCEAANVSICSYHAGRKMCIVGDPSLDDVASPGATYMIKVEEKGPFAEDKDPFEETCEEERDELKSQLDKCRADLDGATKKPPTCGVDKWGKGWYKVTNNVDLANCKIACNADPKCLSYSDSRGPGGNCYLYDKETADVPHGTYANWVQYDKRCR